MLETQFNWCSDAFERLAESIARGDDAIIAMTYPERSRLTPDLRLGFDAAVAKITTSAEAASVASQFAAMAELWTMHADGLLAS